MLIRSTPFGSIDFLSKAFPARISDPELADAADLTRGLWEGMDLMADKGFLISQELFSIGVGLICPTKKVKGARFSSQALNQTNIIARHRIHCERSIRRLQERCGMFNAPVRLCQLWMVDPCLTIMAGVVNIHYGPVR